MRTQTVCPNESWGRLTSAGKPLYEDAKTIIKLSEDALNKAKRLSETSEYTVRIGTSLLYKCRLLPDIWAKISEQYPDLKIEILSMSGSEQGKLVFSARHKV